MLGARVCGDWTRALNVHARRSAQDQEKAGDLLHPQERVVVMMDGPYGGSTIDVGEYESVLFLAGGSGATFTVGLLDDIVGRVLKNGRRNGERTQRIEFAWCIRSFGCISWFSQMLLDIAKLAAADESTISLHITIFVTCLCNAEEIAPIPNCDVIIEKPSVRQIMAPLMIPLDAAKGNGGGLALAVSGPESLTAEALNSVAALSLAEQRRAGGVGIHTEVFAL